MSYYVYILKSLKDGKYYIGCTSDVEARLQFHNSGLQWSTKSQVLVELVLFETHPSKELVLKREKQIKGGKEAKRLKIG